MSKLLPHSSYSQKASFSPYLRFLQNSRKDWDKEVNSVLSYNTTIRGKLSLRLAFDLLPEQPGKYLSGKARSQIAMRPSQQIGLR